MHITKYGYRESKPQAWVLKPFLVGKVLLLAGKNATGKSRTLNVIAALSKLLSEGTVADGEFDVTFDSGLRYELKVEGQEVVQEKLTDGGDVLMERDATGKGWLVGHQVSKLDFELSRKQVAAFAKRDKLQHKYLEPLFDWAEQLRIYRFGSDMGMRSLIVRTPEDSAVPPLDLRDPQNVVALFEVAQKSHEGFSQVITDDLREIGYDAESVSVEEFKVQVRGVAPGPILGLSVKEAELGAATRQLEMSQGMFRALSILIHVNHVLMSGSTSTILLDDIGEGLDFQRSSALIEILLRKVEASGIQLVMSTNDRNIMNAVPLKYWGMILRAGHECEVASTHNSEKFEDFAITGLANSDFLHLEYWRSEDSEA